MGFGSKSGKSYKGCVREKIILQNFKNCSVKNYNFTIVILKSAFLELLYQKCIFKIALLKYILKIAFSQKNIFKITLSKK